jgi:hypothetical protein
MSSSDITLTDIILPNRVPVKNVFKKMDGVKKRNGEGISHKEAQKAQKVFGPFVPLCG